MVDGYMVFVADEDAQERGDIVIFTDASEAASHAESLLEAGYDQSRIRVFSSKEMDVHVTHRPVVSLAGVGSEDAPAGRIGDASDKPAGEAGDGSDKTVGDAAGTDESEGEDEVQVAGVKDGVRLSSMFKSE